MKDKTIFSSSHAAPCSKVIVKSESSTRRYLRHLNSPFLKLSTGSMHVICWSLTHRNFGSSARTFRSSWLSRVLLRVTLASLLLSPFMNNGFRLIPLMLRLSSILGWFSKREPMPFGNSALEGVPSHGVATSTLAVIVRERRDSWRS
ncbi:hypothetical protein TRIUR3_06223 [Triticum urartu]|uniref:Uncharacterized protein n=1 Tax=Triticum urartu TaxID=4572 RepID=M8AM92_TRIUA|nr:hypothetical protein TRIUR3_06223 [Triticum urartu]